MNRLSLAVLAFVAALLVPAVAPAQQTILTYVGTLDEKTRMGTQTFTIKGAGKPNSFVMEGKIDLNFNVRMLLISVHVINQSSWVETWENGKLVGYKGQTRDRDDNYTIEMTTASAPTVTAAKNKDKPTTTQVSAEIAPASFWLESWFMKTPRAQYLSTNSGKVKSAKAPKLEGQVEVNYKGQKVKTNYYTMDFAGDKYELWYFADTGLLYKRVEPSEGGKVAFTLQ